MVRAGGATGPLDTPRYLTTLILVLWGLAAFAAGSQARRVIP